MENFIDLCIDFINDLFIAISTKMNLYFTGFDTFLNKNIINGDLLTISMTYKDLLTYGLSLFVIFGCIFVIIKLFTKLFYLFKL